MANEAVIIELPRNLHPVRRTCADGTTIEKNTILKLTDPNTVSASSASADEFGGIAAAEKVASDGATSMAVHLSGVFGLVATAAAITIGEQVAIGGANTIRAATEAEVQLGQWIGYAEEATAGSETIRVRLRGQ